MSKDLIRGLIGSQESMTNSYKYLFFRSIIEILIERNFKNELIYFDELAREMLVISWPPILRFNLSFGTQDKIRDILIKNVEEESGLFELNTKKQIRHEVSKIPYEEYSEILRYVPQRILSGFFREELRNKKDYEKDAMIIQLSQENNQSFYALYNQPQMKPKASSRIIINEPWMKYIENNHQILIGWLERHWIGFLESRNRYMPAISKKLENERKRNLTKERQLWKPLIIREKLKCIYTNAPLVDSQFELDHFIPEDFVAHNELWNLIPVAKFVDGKKNPNASKNKSLPNKKYLEKMIDIQFKFIEYHSKKSKKKFKNILIDYKHLLRLSSDQICNKEIFKNRMNIELELNIDSAINHGFHPGWTYEDFK